MKHLFWQGGYRGGVDRGDGGLAWMIAGIILGLVWIFDLLDFGFRIGLDSLAMTYRFLTDEGTAWWMARLEALPGVRVETIGKSRAGRPIYCVRVGKGPVRCSITAGAHADEPAGPMAACVIAETVARALAGDDGVIGLPEGFDGSRLSFTIFPQVNPDGAQANSSWFEAVADPLTYLRLVRRELPGDDVEFAYPGYGQPALRPENEAVAGVLRGEVERHGAFHFHASLHSMGLAQGGWVLLDPAWVDRSAGLRPLLAGVLHGRGFTLHDIDRGGDKGFTRIARGFCTTPSSAAMRRHFERAGNLETAGRFGLNSMEFVRSLGGDPLTLVTELPVFAIGGGWQGEPVDNDCLDGIAPAPGSTLYEQSREALAALKKRVAGMGGGEGAGAAVADFVQEFDLRAVPFGVQVDTMRDIFLTAAKFVADGVGGGGR